jgi:hypothetical protein
MPEYQAIWQRALIEMGCPAPKNVESFSMSTAIWIFRQRGGCRQRGYTLLCRFVFWQKIIHLSCN